MTANSVNNSLSIGQTTSVRRYSGVIIQPVALTMKGMRQLVLAKNEILGMCRVQLIMIRMMNVLLKWPTF